MPPRRARPAPPTCTHCGRRGHTSNICTRDDYSPDAPSLGCTTCVRDVSAARSDDTTYKIYVAIIPCPQHDTMVANPPVTAQLTPLQLAMRAAPRPGPSQQAAPSAPPTSAPTLVQPPPLPAPTPGVLPAGPQSGRSYSLERIDSVYRGVVENVNQGKTHEEAFTILQTKRRTFRAYRNIAEARLVDMLAFERLIAAHVNPTLSDCDTEAKKILQRTTSKTKLRDLHLAGAALKPAK